MNAWRILCTQATRHTIKVRSNNINLKAELDKRLATINIVVLIFAKNKNTALNTKFA